jgi:hypothetical protein
MLHADTNQPMTKYPKIEGLGHIHSFIDPK